jgi:hypothetical protein
MESPWLELVLCGHESHGETDDNVAQSQNDDETRWEARARGNIPKGITTLVLINHDAV